MRSYFSSPYNLNSTHSICIAKNNDYTLPSSIEFTLGEFGWEEGVLDTIEEKASYLFTAIYEDEAKLMLLKTYLEHNNIAATFVLNIKYPYIDHANELYDFIEDVLSSEKLLFNYLFSVFSFIITGNDNSDSDVDIRVDYEHYEYYKGN